MKSIVTGGAGFIGSHLVERLDNLGHDVVVLDDFSTGEPENLPKRHMDKARIVDITDCDLISHCEGADYIFHMAARPNVQGSIDHPEVSAYDSLATLKILNVARKLKVKRVIFSSSCSIYGDAEEIPTTEEESKKPKSPYALSKYQGEQYCRLFSELYGLDSVCLRYFNVYGERQPTKGQYAPVIGLFQKQKADGQLMTVVGDGEQRRDFTYVKDIVNANIMAALSNADKEAYGKVYNVGSGVNYSVNEVAAMISENVKYIPPRLGEARISLANVDKIYNTFAWKPQQNLEEWVKKQIGN